ncbi:hypothetical protein [Pseudomonas oryzihabitans]|uniref:hypothetical protein n=1 Tax=Pseudomonas oryzihabitans TaxID=47885 RepID=UPI00241C3D09|nr:hypothetical protein [Pseudomonas oryzihabitans]
MNFLNNWSQPITLGADVTSCPLGLPDGDYRLTIADSATKATAWEIVDASVSGGTAALYRAQEGTQTREWKAGSVIYCSITAAMLSLLFEGQASITSLSARIVELEGRVNALEGGIALTSELKNGEYYGFTIYTNDYAYPAGAISPSGASTIPGAAAAPGADGELMGIIWNSQFQNLIITIRGSYASKADLPFASFKIGSQQYNISSFGNLNQLNGAVSCFVKVLDNPLPEGTHKISFS